MEKAGALDEIPEFADIARPGVLHQQRHRAGVIAAFGVGRHLALEVADERRNILDAAGPAGDLEHNPAEPEEQVLAEFAFGDRGAAIAVGGRNDADVMGLHIASVDPAQRPTSANTVPFDTPA